MVPSKVSVRIILREFCFLFSFIFWVLLMANVNDNEVAVLDHFSVLISIRTTSTKYADSCLEYKKNVLQNGFYFKGKC